MDTYSPRIKGLLRTHLRAIAAGTATWRNYHLAAVLLSEQADLWWEVTGRRTTHQQHVLLHRGASYLDYALKLLEDEHPNMLADNTIVCDMVILMARHVRALNNRDLAHEPLELLVQDGRTGMQTLLMREAEKLPATERWAYWHQAAIAAAVEFKLRCGTVFGFLTEPDTYSASEAQNDALGRFQGMTDEASPDQEQAYRLLLLDAALFEESQGDWMQQYTLAAAALSSAWQFGDIAHAVRAMAIMAGGHRAHRALSALRLAKMIV